MINLALSLQETANSIEIQASDGTIVADLINSDDCCVTESMRQYAALFAAAPDMLAALKAAIAFIGQTHEYKTGHTGADEIVRNGSSVVRKAESGK